MPRSKWRTNLVNAFPIPDDRKPKKKGAAEQEQELSDRPEAQGYVRQGTFPFSDLPGELRRKIYSLVLFDSLDPLDDTHNVSQQELIPNPKNLSLLVLQKSIHSEASHLLYSTATFRLFPLQDFLGLPTLGDIAPYYRTHITRLSITFGPSWTAPPASWRVSKGVARMLGRLRGVRCLRIFVTLDPTQPDLKNFRVSYTFYTDFCGNLLKDVLKAMPKETEMVELAGHRHVGPYGPLVSRLAEEASQMGKMVVYGKQCGWAQIMERQTETERLEVYRERERQEKEQETLDEKIIAASLGSLVLT